MQTARLRRTLVEAYSFFLVRVSRNMQDHALLPSWRRLVRSRRELGRTGPRAGAGPHRDLDEVAGGVGVQLVVRVLAAVCDAVLAGRPVRRRVGERGQEVQALDGARLEGRVHVRVRDVVVLRMRRASGPSTAALEQPQAGCWLSGARRRRRHEAHAA